MKEAIIVIDMLKDFCRCDGALYVGDQVVTVIANCKKIIDKAIEDKKLVVYVNDFHTEYDKEFALFPPHAIIGTKGVMLIDELDRGLLEIKKTRYSGFYETPLESILKSSDIDTIHLIGVCTDICVMYTASDARNRDIGVIVHADAVTSFDLEAHRNAIVHMKNILGCEIVGVI